MQYYAVGCEDVFGVLNFEPPKPPFIDRIHASGKVTRMKHLTDFEKLGGKETSKSCKVGSLVGTTLGGSCNANHHGS